MAAGIVVGRIYETVIAEGKVRARVTCRVPATKTSRNERFHMVNAVTGECLPRLKRASDLAPTQQ